MSKSPASEAGPDPSMAISLKVPGVFGSRDGILHATEDEFVIWAQRNLKDF